MEFLVSEGMSEGTWPFSLKIFDKKISAISISGECTNYILHNVIINDFCRKSSFRYLMQLSGRDPFQFSDPERFLPERWLRGCPVQHNAHPYASIIFSHGPRMCIGRRYAELENYILAIKILQRYRLEYHHGDVGINTEFVNKPDKDIKLKFILRK